MEPLEVRPLTAHNVFMTINDECHGFAEDGRMVKSTTYYFGLAWDFPLATDNDAQTDEYIADMTFQVVQHRNNPDKIF